MLRKPTISFLLLLLLLIHPLFLPKVFSTQSGYVLPLGLSNWKGTGNIESKPEKNNEKQSILLWQPLHQSAYLKSTSIPTDWHFYDEIEITLQSNKATRSWINILLCDKKNAVASTYIEIDFTGEKVFHLSTKGQFPSFSRSNTVDWNQMAFFAFESHSIANLGIDELQLTIKKIKIQTANTKTTYPKIDLSPNQKKSLFFAPEFFEIIEKNQEKMVHHTLQNIEKMVQEANLAKTPTPENLFYWTLHQKLHKKSMDFSYQNRSAALFQKSYWESLLRQNDILIQENGLFFLLTYDLIQADLRYNAASDEKFTAILQFLAEIEFNQCQYWINTYPYGQGNNHVTRAASFLAILAYYHHDLVRRNMYYQFAQQVLDYYFAFQIDREGSLNEGTHYYIYLMEILSYYGYFEWYAHQRNILKDFSYSPKLNNMTHWAEAIRMPNGFLPAVDDAWQTRVIFPIRLISPLLEDKSRGNFISTCQDSTNIVGDFPWNFGKPLYIPLFLFSAGETFEITSPNETPSRIFFQENQVVFKKDWSFQSSYVFFIGKQKPSLHEHDDTAQIQIFANQIPILLDSGYGPAGWSSKQRDYYISGSAHNVVTIDSQGPKANYNGSIGPTDKSSILDSYLTPSMQYVSMNISRNVLFRDTNWKRTVFYIPETENSPFYCVVLDNLSSPKEHLYECIFHPNGEVVRIKDDTVVFQKNVREQNETINIILQSLQPRKVELKKGYYSPYWGEEYGSSYVCYSDRAKQSSFSTMITSTSKSSFASVSQVLNPSNSFQNENEYAFTVNQQENSFMDFLFKNPDRKLVQGSWISSNGAVAYIRKENGSNKILSFVSIRSSFLNLQKTPLYYAQNNIDYLYFSSDNSLYDYFLEYESFALSNRIYLNLFDISKVLLDNKEVEFENTSGGISFSLPPGKHYVLLFQKGEV